MGAAALRLSAADMAELEAAVPAHEARTRLTVTAAAALRGAARGVRPGPVKRCACVYVTWPSFMLVLYKEERLPQ